VTLPAWWPRTSCVYCAARLPDVRSGFGGSFVAFPFTIACVKHAPIVAFDPEYAEAAP
jgi:hypothetical protein